MIKPIINNYQLFVFKQKDWGRDWLWLLGFFLAAVLLWSLGLGDVPLRDWDEGIRALIAREIYRSGNWLHPTMQGEPYLLKPPLLDWLIAISYQFGGVNELTTRLPGAILTACGVPILYLVGRELFPQPPGAIFAAGVYLTLLPVVRHGRLAMLDGVVNSFYLLLLLSLLKARQHQPYALGIGICLGLITFTKGLLVVPLAVIAFLFLLANRQVSLFKSPYLWLGLLLGNLPVFAWYIAQGQQYGATFWQVHFFSQGLERLSQTVEGNTGPVWYYLLELIKYSWPWLFFWPGGLALAWRQRQTSRSRLVLLGTVVYLGLISLMRTKLPWYIMPLYPFFALAVAAKLSQFWQNYRPYPRVLVALLGLIAVAGLGGFIYFIKLDPQPALMIMAIVLSLTMTIAAWQVQQNQRNFIPTLFLGMYLSLSLLMSSQSWLWELNEAFPVKPVAALLQKQTEPGTVIYTSFGYSRPSLDFYSDRQVIPADAATLKQLWSNQSYLLLQQPTLTQLQLPGSMSLGTAEGFTLVGKE